MQAEQSDVVDIIMSGVDEEEVSVK